MRLYRLLGLFLIDPQPPSARALDAAAEGDRHGLADGGVAIGFVVFGIAVARLGRAARQRAR